jgi:Holliday junction resolvase
MNVKKKGNHGENEFANWLQENGIKAWRNGSSGAGLYKGDINNSIDCTFEVKTVKKINLLKAWGQVSRDSSIAHNSPVLAIHFDGMGKRQWLIVIHSEDWIDLIKNQIK